MVLASSWMLGCLAVSSVLASPPVQVELRSSWGSPPFLVEILETLAMQDESWFFRILDVITNPEEDASKILKLESPRDVYQSIINLLPQHIFYTFDEPGALASLEMELALHSAIPRIEAGYQHYHDQHFALPELCESWVDWYGQIVCDGETLKHLLETEMIEPSHDSSAESPSRQPKILPFDHVAPLSKDKPRTAILYASFTSSNFRELHDLLHWPQRVRYILRHIPPSGHGFSTKKTYLSGYGVALDLKKMEYLALDDRNQPSSSESRSADDTSARVYDSDPIVALLQQYPENDATDYSTPLSSEELLQIGLQSTQLLYDSDDALSALAQLSQNFPKYASAVSRRVVVRSELEEEIHANQFKAQGGVSMMWLNGAVVPEGDVNAFSLLRLMKKESKVMAAATGLGLSPSQAVELLTHKAIGVSQGNSGVLDALFDASDRPEGGDTIVWWNDIETDARYARWNPSLSVLLTPMYPGQLPNVKLNLFNIVLVVDLSQSSSISFISSAVSNIISRGFPLRFGVVPIVESDEATRMARLFYWIMKHFGRSKAMKFFTHISQAHLPIELLTPSVDWSSVEEGFAALLSDSQHDLPDGLDANLDSILRGGDNDSDIFLRKAGQYARRLSTDLATASQGHAFVNGKHFNLDDDFLRNMQGETAQQLQHLQEQLYLGIISEEDSERMSTYFYDRPEASKRRNKYIFPTSKSGGPGELRIINLIDLLDELDDSVFHNIGDFVSPKGDARTPITTFVIADLDSRAGLTSVKDALLSVGEGSISRITFIHNPVERDRGRKHSPSALMGHLIMAASLSKLAPSQLITLLENRLENSNDQPEQVLVTQDSNEIDIMGILLSDDAYATYLDLSEKVVHKLGLSPGEQALMVNGRVIGPIDHGDFTSEDFNELAAYEFRRRVSPVIEALEDTGRLTRTDTVTASEVIAYASSLIASIHLPDPSESGLFNTPIRPRRRSYQLLAGSYTKFEYGDNSTALYHFGVLLDPLSEAAQKWSTLLQWLSSNPAVYLEVHINPPQYKELPLKRFYRYNVSPTLRFDEQGRELPSIVQFQDLPEEPIYTLAMDVPPSWLVRPREASCDLDNILLSALSHSERTRGVHATFELDFLVVEGHAREEEVLAPPRGLQLQLVNSNNTPIADTLVVANLGYHQFRAKPGVYRFEIRPGRGREIFRLSSVGSEGWDSPTIDAAGDEVTVMSFEGLTLYPRTERRPGMEDKDVLSSPPADVSNGNVVQKLKSKVASFFGAEPDAQSITTIPNNEQAEINIFTVASGLLYERFASIMILSVLRNTKSTVKFWFIENFLSPSFLEFVPHFAEAYGFQYELVTYKWPSWLRAQKEKQRIIWAYKILFLDVLFPMDLKKVIFVDADQIVRADLKELVDLDLHGAPYGYTPMGDDNAEMEGFRFWKTGYWKDFLRGRPYHISALYVVDLVRFRQLAAGDILRTHYHQLSADPNSLANLDQDLPNNLQREVPIFSLDKDWLWCETWCSKDRLDRAKTIDLCQNPLTKEPKLERAKHIPEWEGYDSEIAQFARQLAEKGAIHSGMATADATALADVGSGKTMVSENDQHGEVPDPNPEPEGHVKDEL